MQLQWKKKRSEETQTLRAGCSKVVSKIFTQPQNPFPGGAGRPKFNQLGMVTAFTYKPRHIPTSQEIWGSAVSE